MIPNTFSAPGRVNLIGEHTDYTGGLVLPMAIPFATQATLGPAENGGYSFRSVQFPASRSLSPEDRSPRVGNWTDYPVGVLRELQSLGIEPPPFSLQIEGNVPLGAGLSSSASIEVVTAVALLAHAQATLPLEKIALLAQRAENAYVGSPCGIMDQFVSTAATAGHALLLNTFDLTFDLLPMNIGELANCRVVIINSEVKHTVTEGSAYEGRRREVEMGQAAVQQRFAVRDLGEASIEQLNACKGDIPHNSFLRCRHIVTENARVRDAGAAMRKGDPVALGSLMTAAHASYRDDFGASVPEVDFLVEQALTREGCYGARLTGGGFGGCTVNLVAAEHAESFAAELRAAYKQRFHIEAATYVCEAVDGAIARSTAAGVQVTPDTLS